ncbi:MAG: type II secretion system F family protein [Candidatus Binataceae bacterium]
MTSFFVSLAVFCLIAAGSLSIYVALYGSHRIIEERFNDLAIKIRASQGVFEDDDQDETVGRVLFKWAAERIPKPSLNTPSGEKISHALLQAGFIGSNALQTLQVARFFAMAAVAAFGVILGFSTGQSAGGIMIFAVLGAVVGFFSPTYYVARRARIRQTAIARQLSDTLDLLVVCVEAGLGLYEAIRIVGAESERQHQEIGRELALVSNEIAAGASLGQALRKLAERTDVEDIKPLAATLIQSEQLGAQIAPSLRASSDALRTRRRLRAEETAQKTTIKILFPLVLFVLPAMLLVIIGPALIQIIRTLSH